MRDDEKTREYLLKPETVERLKYIFYKKLRRTHDFEDFYHDYIIHVLEGHGTHQTLDYFAIDWLRGKTFYNRKKKTAPAFCEFKTNVHISQIESIYLGQGYKDIVHDLASKYKGRARILVFLYYIYGLNHIEIAKILNLTEPRISQLLTMIRLGKKVKDPIPTEDDIGLDDQTEVEKLRLKNKILSNKLAKAFREKNGKG